MAIDIHREHLLTFPQAAKRLPGHPHLSTLHRWRLHGVRGTRLETCRIGGKRFTSREALERFALATTAAADGEPVPCRTPRQRERAIERAVRELAET